MGSLRPHPEAESGEGSPRSGRARPTHTPPEEVFLLWLLWLPDGAEVKAAARSEIERIDASRADDPRTLRLKSLFQAVATYGWISDQA